jgi:hypothetical protein
VDKVNIEVFGLELREGQVEVGLDELGAVRVVPQLGDEDDFLAWDSGLGNTVGDLVQISTVRYRTGRSRVSGSLRFGSLWFTGSISMVTRRGVDSCGLTVDLFRSARVVWSHGADTDLPEHSQCVGTRL